MDTTVRETTAMREPPRQLTNAKGQPVCGARTRNSRCGMPTCQSTALEPTPNAKGFRRCRMHGGFAARGTLAVQATAGGRYSRHLPAKLRAAYDRASADPAVLSLREEVALLNGRIELALQGLDGGVALERVVTAWAGYEAATASREASRIVEAAGVMRQAIGALGGQAAALRDVERLMLLKARLSWVESKRQIAAATMLDAASAWALVTAVGELVKTHVGDPVARRAIAEGLVRLTHRGALPRPE